MDTLTKQQKSAFALIDKNKNIFITARGAGCGKTFLLQHIINRYSKSFGYNKKIAVTASTGVAAVLISGITLHSWAGIGLGKKPVSSLVREIENDKYKKKRWLETEMLIIDEISLISPILFDKLECIARHVRKNCLPFGGIQLVISGDWLQLPNMDGDNYAFESKAWEKCIDDIVYLTEIKRQHNKEFQDVLNSIRVGKITKQAKKLLRSRLNVSLENEFGIIPTKLYSLNINVERINNRHLNELLKYSNRTKKTFKINWNPKKKEDREFTKYLKLCNLCENLELCIGAQVMLLINKSQEQGLVNGSRGIIKGFNSEDLPIVKFLNGTEDVIELSEKIVEIDNRAIGTFKQLPLKLGYATTIHKSQGSTLDYVEIDLSNIFELSQAYVGLSRVKSLEGLSILNLDFKKFGVNIKALRYYKKLEKNCHH